MCECIEKVSLRRKHTLSIIFFDIQLNELVNDQTYYFFNIAELRSYLRPEDSIRKLRKATYTKHEGYQLFNLYEAFMQIMPLPLQKKP